MRIVFALLLAGLVFLAGCASHPVRPTDPAGQEAFDALHPGGPVFAPREYVVEFPMPAETPFGKYFANDQKRLPPNLKDPYWINGQWVWLRTDWDWVQGRWVERPRPGAIWINGHTIQSAGRTYWVTGYWE